MSGSRDELVVDLDAGELGDRRPAGVLRQARARGHLDVAFAYDPAWLRRPRMIDLDPELGRYEGDQRPARGPLHGAFADTTPDRWGRLLLTRRETYAARREGRRPRTLDDWDFLVGVRDDLRLGALRLRRGETCVAPAEDGGVPPMTRLRELQQHAARAERGEELSLARAESELALLLAPGSSLGGARPKANFSRPDGSLWIAKFPSREDLRDVGAWEWVANRLAAGAGIEIPDHGLLRLQGAHATYCARRFDRLRGSRRFFISAMTATQKRDGDAASYLDIAEAIEDYGDPRSIEADLEQLFRRAAFAALCAHRDDHLRNHGFLHNGRGLTLAPAFDLNPLPEKPEHVLAFDGFARFPDLDVIRKTAGYYRLKPGRADKIVGEVRAATRGWRALARKAGLSRSAVELMSAALGT